MEFGIVGLPYVGKTTLFNALTRAHVQASASHRTSKDGSRAVVEVDDPRLMQLAAVFHPPKITRAVVTYVDLAGVSAGAFERGSMTPQFLASLRATDALVHVVRGFEDDRIPHVAGTLDPARDVELVELEFILADLQIVEHRLERLEKEVRIRKDRALDRELAALHRCQETLEAGRPLRELDIDADEEHTLRGFQFLTQKPMLLVLNTGEEDPRNTEPLTAWRGKTRTAVVAVCAEMEMELAELSDAEGQDFREQLGLEGEPALPRLIRASYDLLRIVTFFTCAENEVRAWTVPEGATAVDAAATIHSDLARGFIRAETIQWEELVEQGSYANARHAGLLRLEGKEYRVQDGDVLLIRFNV